MKLYAFDVDETLTISGGPVHVVKLRALHNNGHVVGICGNFAVLTAKVPDWHRFISFIGQMEMSKPAFLTQLKRHIPAEEYIMVGNIPGVSGSSADQPAAAEAGFRFISEADFANGER